MEIPNIVSIFQEIIALLIRFYKSADFMGSGLLCALVDFFFLLILDIFAFLNIVSAICIGGLEETNS